MTRERWILAGAIVVAACVTVLASGDDAQDQADHVGGLAFRDEIELTVVNVIVNVTDDDGKPVTDLTADDFRIYHNGEPRTISNFQLYTEDLYRQLTEPGAPVVPPPVVETVEPDLELRPVWVVVYVDQANLAALDRNRVLNQARDFITQNARPPVQMMVISRLQSVKVLQDFTSDPRPVLDVLRGLRQDSTAREGVERDRAELIQTMQSREYNPSNLNDPRQIRSDIANFAREETTNLQFTLGSLRQVIDMMAGLEGKKAILYVSNGLPLIPGIGLYHAYAAAFDDSSALSEATAYDQSRAFEGLVAAANAQDISLYTIDAGGLQMSGAVSAEYRDSQDFKAAAVARGNYLDSLRFMADSTGGLAIVDTNDVRPWLEKIEHDFYTYYSIGYPLQQGGTDKVHEIKVEIPAHPDYELRYRRRFAEKSLETRVQEKVVSGLVLPLDENPMDIELTPGRAAPASVDRWTLPLKVSFPVESVAMIPEGDDYVARLVLFVAARDTKGGQSDVVRQNHEVRVPAGSLEQAQGHRFKIDVSLLMKEGSHAVSVGLLDLVTRQSSYETTRTAVPTSG